MQVEATDPDYLHMMGQNLPAHWSPTQRELWEIVCKRGAIRRYLERDDSNIPPKTNRQAWLLWRAQSIGQTDRYQALSARQAQIERSEPQAAEEVKVFYEF